MCVNCDWIEYAETAGDIAEADAPLGARMLNVQAIIRAYGHVSPAHAEFIDREATRLWPTTGRLPSRPAPASGRAPRASELVLPAALPRVPARKRGPRVLLMASYIDRPDRLVDAFRSLEAAYGDAACIEVWTRESEKAYATVFGGDWARTRLALCAEYVQLIAVPTLTGRVGRGVARAVEAFLLAGRHVSKLTGTDVAPVVAVKPTGDDDFKMNYAELV